MAKNKRPKGKRIAWAGNAPGGNYTEKVLALSAQVVPGVNRVEVRHDDWCAIYRKLPCNCDPEVELVSDDG